MKKTISDFIKNKERDPYVCLTAYTAPMVAAADPYCDLLLVGDSVSMVLYGKDSTQGASMPMMIAHGQAVVKHAKNALVVVDMPFGSYEESDNWALKCASVIMDKTGCDAVKLEGGEAMATRIQTLTEHDIPVMAHIGLLPQSVSSPGGYRVQGRKEEAARQLMRDAQAVSEAGAFCVVIEAVPEPLAAAITESCAIPTIGIGASSACDGQILVSEDMLGLSLGTPPKFVKPYANLSRQIDTAIQAYAAEVKARACPAEENIYQDKQNKAA